MSYQNERGDLLALLDSQRTSLGTQLDYFKALSEFEAAVGDLERAIGADIPPDMTAMAVTEGTSR